MSDYFSFLDEQEKEPTETDTDYFSFVDTHEIEGTEKIPSFWERFGKAAALQPSIAYETAKQSPELLRQAATGAIKGATLEAAKPQFEKEPETQAEAFAQEMGRLIGLSGPIGVIGKLFSPLGTFGRILGSGVTGGAVKAGRDYFGSGEINPKEIAKEAAIWGGIELLFKGGQLINYFRKMVNFISKRSGESKATTLRFLKDKVVKKFKGEPLDPNTIEIEPEFAKEILKTAEEATKDPSIIKPPKKPPSPPTEPPSGKPLDESISFTPKERPKTKEKPSFRTAVIDELYPIQKYVEGADVKDLPILENPYKMARLHKGWSGKASTFLHPKGHTFDPITLNKVGKSFGKIIQAHRNELQNFSKYLVAKRAIELSKRGIETGIDLNDARKFLKENSSKFEKSTQELQKYNRDLLDFAEKSGLLSKDLRMTFENLNKDYVPFKRVMDETPEEYFGRTMQPKKVFHQIKGSKRQIIDPLESIIDNTYLITRAADQNMVLKSLVDFDKKHRGVGKFIEVTDEKTGKQTLKNFFDYLKGEDVIRDDTIRYFDKGKIHTYKVPKDIAEALKGMKYSEFTFVDKVLSFPTRLVRLKAITMSPTKLLKLAAVDQLEAFLYTNLGYIPYFNMAKGLFHALGKTDLYFDWLKAGGDQALIRNLSREIKQEKLNEIAKINRLKTTFTSMDSLVRALEEISRPLEEATRLGVFELAKKKGFSSREAALMSREATLDFMVKGAKTRLLQRAIPFFNAAIQGADKFVREVKKNPNLWLKAISLVTIPTLMLWYDNKDRKEYQELPDWDKDNFWHFYAGPIHLRFPKPYELGAVFATTPERIASYINEKDPKNLKRIFESLLDVFTPSFTPSIVQLPVETFANRSLFGGTPIIAERLKRLPPEEQYYPYTSETAKALGKMISKIPMVGETKAASPIIIERWLDFWTAGLGMKAIRLSESALRKTGVLPKRVEVAKEFAELPGIKAFMGKKAYSRSAASINEFYEESDRLEKMNNQIKSLKKQGKIQEAKKVSEKFDVSKYKLSKRIRSQFSKQHQMIRNIQLNNEDFSPEEKAANINEIVENMVNISRGFLNKK